MPSSSPGSTPIGVLVAQLGTPDAPTAPALRRYLREFLGDRRVVDLNPVLWALVLHGAILPFRPRRSAALYRRVWTDRGSPLLYHSEDQVRGLAERLGPGWVVELGMRYGSPGIRPAIERLLAAGAQRFVVLPMFPQYAGATTGSALDAITSTCLDRRDVPSWRVVRDYPTDPAYVGAIAGAVRDALGPERVTSTHLVLSFHGVPKRYIEEGDPYESQCRATAEAVAGALALSADRWTIAFQSQFGREEWIGPATDRTLEELARSGQRSVAVVCPGFPTDCLETIDEIGREAKHSFLEAGGEVFLFVPGLNAAPVWLDAMAELVRREAAGWR